jgi:hypothetical protein
MFLNHLIGTGREAMCQMGHISKSAVNSNDLTGGKQRRWYQRSLEHPNDRSGKRN